MGRYLTAALLLLSVLLGTEAMAESGKWRALTLKAPGTIAAVLRVGGDVYLELENTGTSGLRFRKLRLVAGRPVLEDGADSPVGAIERRPDMLPDGVVSRGDRGIVEAWLASPTRRYGHGVIGDRVEAGGLRAVDGNGALLRLDLPPDSVFEDRLARLADLNGDGVDEILVVRSYLDAGAAIAVVGLAGGRLGIVAEGKPVGLPNRWLNPAGVGDFDGDGRTEFAIVVTPHIGGTLVIYELTETGLKIEGKAFGYSNHEMGSRELGLSAVVDANGDGVLDLVLPTAARRGLEILTFLGRRFAELATVQHESAITTAIEAGDLDGDGLVELVYGLEDNTLVILGR
ncbi:MAG: VCBS repeat-containing protein [Alphaproteobacteria bacterium]|jgi:hypothetical protein|nr:VCBS repeat-containing protein [Alphaproteobacteria bacterium]